MSSVTSKPEGHTSITLTEIIAVLTILSVFQTKGQNQITYVGDMDATYILYMNLSLGWFPLLQVKAVEQYDGLCNSVEWDKTSTLH